MFGNVSLGPDATLVLERQRRLIEYAAELGCAIYCFLGGQRVVRRRPTDEEFKRLGEQAETLIDFATPHGLTVAYLLGMARTESRPRPRLRDDLTFDLDNPRGTIEWVTSIHALEPGDVLATGTNHRGLSAFQDGDVIELETQGLGKLRFNVRDPLKRTWDRETRLDRQQKGQEGTTPQLSGQHTPAKR